METTRGGRPTYARIITLETTPEQHEQGVRLVGEQLLPWARESSGFRGLIGLVELEQGTSLAISLWADEQSLQASADAAERLSGLAAQSVGASRRSIEDFDVSLFEVEG